MQNTPQKGNQMQLATIQPQAKIGGCPHGLPAGACPICSGMGGGGVKKADFSAKPGEMSWNECAAIGAFLRAQKAAQQAKEADFQAHIQALQAFKNTMANASERAAQFAQMVQNSLPPILAKPIAFVMNNIIANSLNFISNLPTNIANFVQNTIQNIAQTLTDIASKLTAVYGELKAAISEKLSKPIQKFKEKIKSIFKIFKSSETDDEDKKVEEAKRTFELKTFIHKLYRKLKKDAED